MSYEPEAVGRVGGLGPVRWGVARFVCLGLLAVVGWGCMDLGRVERTISPYSESAPPQYRGVDVIDWSDVDKPSLPDGFEIPDVQVDGDDFILTQVDPSQGDIKGGDFVMLVGAGFKDDMQVYFSEAKAGSLFVVTPNFATVLTPPHTPGLADVTIIGDAGEKFSLMEAFLYTADLVVESVEPAQGPVAGGTPLVVTGTGFDQSCKLFVGERMAFFQSTPDHFVMEGVSPPGACGAADVTVSCADATAKAADAFFYDGPPVLYSVEPAVGPASGGFWVDVKGDYFSPLSDVTFGGTPAGAVVYVSGQQLRVKVPPGLEGPVAVEMINECGQALLEGGLVYLGGNDPAPAAPVVVGVVPTSLPACSGGSVTLAVKNLDASGELFVFIGGVSTEVVSIDEGAGTVDVQVGSADAGPADVLLLTSAGNDLVEGLFVFEARPVVHSITPSSGKLEGGLEVLIEGCGFVDTPAAFSEVWFGPSVSPGAVVIDSERVSAVTPPGAPGPVDVLVVSGGQTALAPAGFTYHTVEPQMFFVSPDSGAVAGGTYVRFVGSGFPVSASYFIGDRKCFDVQHVHPSLVTARAPANDPGTYDASVQWSSGSALREGAYTYFNPISKKGGTWGGPIDESLNVTVLDGSSGKGLPAAFVIVGESADGPHQGFTDEKGQITFSLPGLQGKQLVTATKPAYNMYSVVHFDAANVTVYLNPVVLPGGGGSYTPPKAFVGGQVSGFDKYAVIPPGKCKVGQADGLCMLCSSDQDCQWSGEQNEEGDVVTSDASQTVPEWYCAPVTGQGDYCLPSCLQPEDCPKGFGCAKVGPERTACIPLAGKRHIRCETSKTSMFGYPPDPGPGGAVNKHDIYFINAPPGEIAVICYGGYIDYDTNIFRPTVMGLRRNVVVLNNQVLKDQDVVLDIPLTRQARLAFHNLPWHPEGVRKPYIMLSIELGKDGFMNLPQMPEWVDQGQYFRLYPLPEQMSGTLEGATFSLYASVSADTPYSLPYAVKMETGIASLAGDGVVVSSPLGTTAIFPPVDGDIVGLAYRSDKEIYLATDRGEMLFFNGTAWTPVGVPDPTEGFSVMVEDNVGGIWLGGKVGSVWHFNGVGWTHIDPVLFQPVEDLWATNGEAWVVHKSLVAHIVDDVAMSVDAAPGGYQLKAIWGADSKDIWLVSDGASLWNLSPSGWAQAIAYSGYELQDVDGTGPDDIWAVASPSMVLHFDGTYFDMYYPEPQNDLTAVRAYAPDKVFAAGRDGALFALQGGVFVQLETSTVQDFSVVSYSPANDAVAAAGVQAYNIGPFMAYPHVLAPAKDEYFPFDKVAWEFWTEGAQADYLNMTFSTSDGFPFWIMVVDGAVSEVVLPDIVQALGFNVIPDGGKRLNLTASMSPTFCIDHYNNGDFSIYDKISWSVELTMFE